MLDHNQTGLANFNSDIYGTLKVWKDDQGREFFRAIDVCSILRLNNASQALSRYVDDDYIISIDDGTNRAGKTNYLSEPGLYQLIFSSRTDWAKQFQKWVYEDVLPKLRASGGYIMPNATSEQLEALQAEISELKRDKGLITSNFVHMLRTACYSASKHPDPTYEEIFKVLNKTLSANNFGQVYFGKERIKHILTVWTGGNNSQFNKYGQLPCFERDFIPFLKCVAENYYTPGVGGTGEQEALKRLVAGF